MVVEILNESFIPLKAKDIPKSFNFIPESVTPDLADAVATIDVDVLISEHSLAYIFYSVKKKANSLGANAYQIISHDCARSNDSYAIGFQVFNLSDTEMENALSKLTTNKVILFGSLKPGGNPISFKLNGDKNSIDAMEKMEIHIHPETTTSISVGGLLGSSITLKGIENKPVQFYTLGGAGLEGMDYNPQGGGISVSLKSGSLNSLPNDLGWLLLSVL